MEAKDLIELIERTARGSSLVLERLPDYSRTIDQVIVTLNPVCTYEEQADVDALIARVNQLPLTQLWAIHHQIRMTLDRMFRRHPELAGRLEKATTLGDAVIELGMYIIDLEKRRHP